jgi:hypothetical protein
LLTVEYSTPVSTLVTVTVAPGSTPADVSVTTPVIVPRPV